MTKVKRPREKRWKYGAENCVRSFDCWIVSTISSLFLVVSVRGITTGG